MPIFHIPTGIIIDEVLVESGDYVSEGDTLMTVDIASVTAKIAAVQDSITSLDEQIEDVKGDTESTTIKAGVSGRVKKIYTSADESVASRMSESGSLMLISVDGLMAVNISSNSLSAGDSVTVTLSDGGAKTGTVERVSGEVCTITLTDNGPVLGDEVTVTDSDGNEVGTGTLYIHSEISITGTSGTVSSVSVSENQSVSSGTTLLKLTDVAASSEYLSLMSDRQSLAESLQELVTLSQTGAIIATFSGTVSAVNVSAGDTTSNSSSSSSSTDSSSSSNSSNAYGLSNSGAGTAMTLLSRTTIETSNEAVSSVDLYEDEAKEAISSVSGINITAPAAGGIAQTEVTGDSLPYTGKITWSPALENGSSFGYGTAYKATVTMTPKDGYEFSGSVSVDLGGVTAENVTVDSNGTLTFTVSYASTDSAPATPSDNNAATGGSTISGSYGNTVSGSSQYSGSYPSSSSASAGASTAASSSSDSSSSGTSTASVDEIAVISIAPDDNLVIDVSVDELDIMSLAVNQTAAITLDAVENEVFTGTITKVHTTATSSGDVSTYSVTVTVPKTDSMLAGMSASVSIIIEEESGVLIIPVDAVQEQMGSVFVYTEEGEDGTLSGQTDIETGISDGLFVQVVSGLSEGDTVYYTIATSDDAAAENGNFSFGMGGGMGGDMGVTGRPDSNGGSMPDMSGGRQAPFNGN